MSRSLWIVSGIVLLLGSTLHAQDPNLRIAISREFANLAGRIPLDRCDLLRETILDTKLWGLGRTVGEIQLEFVPSTTCATIDLVLHAVNNNVTNTIGMNGPFVLISDNRAALTARKRVYLTPQGITADPTLADAAPTSTLKRIDTPFHGLLDKFARRMAQDGYERNREPGTAHARAIAAQGIARGLDEGVHPYIVEGNRRLITDVREPLQRRNLLPQRMHFLTDDAYLHVLANFTEAGEAPSKIDPHPELPFGTQVGGWVHESLPNGLLARTFAGKKFTGAELSKEIYRMLGALAPTSPPAEEEPFSIQFPDKAPITLAFRDDTIAVTLRSQSFTSGETEYDTPPFRMNLTIRYRVRVENSILRAERVGDVEVMPRDHEPGKRLGVQQQTLRTLMQKQLDPLFPRQLRTNATVPTPAGFREVGRLGLESIVSRQGWLAAGIRWIAPILD